MTSDSLTPEMRADEATKRILRAQLAIITAYEPCVAQDVDPECLHKFRVAVRRSRSVLTQIKGVFPPAVTARFKRDLALVGRATNELRDLDVFLLDEARYRAMLPEKLAAGLEPLFAYLRQKRAAALANTLAFPNGAQYRQIMVEWQTFLHEPVPETPAAPHVAHPIYQVARKRIYKRYRRLVSQGMKILENAADEELHALRIEGKKLRYLLEFFQPLFPAAEIIYLIKQLKQLQANLGDFNDLQVQADFLLGAAADLPVTEESRPTLTAVGGLIALLHREQMRVKQAFAQTFASFAAPDNGRLYQKLFANGRNDDF